jgi:hypothetical protein
MLSIMFTKGNMPLLLLLLLQMMMAAVATTTTSSASHRKRLHLQDVPTPSWSLDRRAFSSAPRAPRALSQHVARSVGSPSDDQRRQGHRRPMQAIDVLAVHPYPRSLLAHVL